MIRSFLLLGILSFSCALVHGLYGGLEMPKEASTTVDSEILNRIRPQVQTPVETVAVESTPVLETPVANEEKTPESAPTEESNAEFTVELLHELWSTNSAILLDARTKEEFTAGHIPGSFHLPLESFTGPIPSLLEAFPTDQLFVVYCGGGDCHASHSVGSLMLNLGYTNVLIYELGYPSWTAAGHPTEEGYFQ